MYVFLYISDYQFGIQLTADDGAKILGTFCARNERDRAKFVEDLKEAILEVSFFIHIHICFDLFFFFVHISCVRLKFLFFLKTIILLKQINR